MWPLSSADFDSDHCQAAELCVMWPSQWTLIFDFSCFLTVNPAGCLSAQKWKV